MSVTDTEMVAELQGVIGYSFRELSILVEGLTHSTYANEYPEHGPHNERLEFVGDAVLGLMTAQILYRDYPNEPEGELSQRRAHVVCREGLAAQARAFDLPRFLRLGQGERRAAASGVTDRVLANAFEGVVGAVYMDGGLTAVEACFGEAFAEALRDADELRDYKTDLQQQCHQDNRPQPIYEVLEILGPDHAREYRCGVAVGEQKLGEGVATSKKRAEQLAAQAALACLKQTDGDYREQ